MECLNYKKGLTCSNYKCQFGYINCANFKYDIWDFNKCRNYNLEPSKDVTVEVKDGEQNNNEELLELYIEKHGTKGNITLPVSSVITLLQDNNDTKRQLKEAKRLLKLAADDIETAMTEEKCKVCGLDYCGNDTICKWRYADEVEKILKL